MKHADHEPLGALEFERLARSVGPFAPSPRVAVATSGGVDSIALCLLTHRWAAARGGACHALVVDHGLRPESAEECRRVAGWLTRGGIETRVLTWAGRKPDRGIQEAAREARYGLLLSWCRDHGLRDLLLAHHRDDQAETFFLRLGRKSGLDGLAAMAGVSHRAGIRVVRPLLGVPKARLVATARAFGHPWIEDPSNRDPRFARSRLRELLPALDAAGVTAEDVAASARRLGRARAALEHYASELVRECVQSHEAGFCWLDRDTLSAAPEEVGLRVLSRVVSAVGARPAPPRHDRLERAYAEVAGGAASKGRTLAGCRIVGHGRRLLVCREARGAGRAVTLHPGQSRRWDARFDVRVDGRARPGPETACEVRRLGAEGWRIVTEDPETRPRARDSGIPAAARATLPALWDRSGLLDVPHLGYRRKGSGLALDARFAPDRPLVFPPFSVVFADVSPV